MKECLWALSNIAASSGSHIEKLIESEAFLIAVEKVLNTKKLAIKNEGLWTICNAITGCDSNARIRIMEITGGTVLAVLVAGARPESKEFALFKNVMEAVDMMLKLDLERGWQKTENAIAYLFEKTGGLDALEDAQKHADFQVYKLAHDILQAYFEQEGMEVQQPQQQSHDKFKI